MRCILGLKDISVDCNYKPLKGLRHRVLLVRFEDVDRVRSVVSRGRAVVDLHLRGGKSGVMVELLERFKLTGAMRWNGGGFAQEITMRFGCNRAVSEGLTAVEAIAKGAWVVVVETMNDDFEVLGFDAGLVLTASTRDYNSNGLVLTLGTPSGLTERYMALEWLAEGTNAYEWKKKRFESGLFEGKRRIFDNTFDSTFE